MVIQELLDALNDLDLRTLGNVEVVMQTADEEIELVRTADIVDWQEGDGTHRIALCLSNITG